MARRTLTPAQLELVQAVHPVLPEGRSARIGFSGGADSLALCAAAAHVVQQTGAQVEAVVVDHGLQDGSSKVADRAVHAARMLGLPARVAQVRVTGEGSGVEAAARTARLAALVGDGSLPVLLGHTLDDQAETVLLGLGRGSGAASLQGMAQVSSYGPGTLVRPLLGVRRATTLQACADWGLHPWEDPMNQDLRFRRVRVRTQLLPLMDDVLGGGAAEALARSATMLRQDNQVLDGIAAGARGRCVDDDSLVCEQLAGLPPALLTRLVRSWLVENGASEPTRAHVLAVTELVTGWRGQQGIDLPGGVRVRRSEGRLVAASSVDG